MKQHPFRHVVVMGVSGSGKTTVGGGALAAGRAGVSRWR